MKSHAIPDDIADLVGSFLPVRRLSRPSFSRTPQLPALSPRSARCSISRRRRQVVALLSAWRGYCRDALSVVALLEDMALRVNQRRDNGGRQSSAVGGAGGETRSRHPPVAGSGR